MASNTTLPNGNEKLQQQEIQNAVNQTQATLEQKTAEAIAANGQSATADGKKDKRKDSKSKKEDKPRKPRRDFPDNSSQYRCLMFFPTSGHIGFDTIKTSDEFPPIETIREMVTYETKIRLSKPIQELMDYYHTDEAALR